jgi:hypothetical protein
VIKQKVEGKKERIQYGELGKGRGNMNPRFGP